MASALPTQLRVPVFTGHRVGAPLVLGLVLLLPALALGQPETPKPGVGDAASAAAKVLMAEGNALYGKSDFEGAHQKFLEAWALKQHAAIASNLVETEMKLGRYAEAAERLRELLSSVPIDDQEERTALLTQLDECRHHLVSLQIAVNVDGATVKVDDKAVGTSPLGREVLVEPGRASVVAELEGHASEPFVMTDGAAGESRTLHLYISPKFEPAPSGAVAKPALPPPPPVAESSGIQPRTIVLLSGAALTVAGTVLGVTYWKLRNDTGDEARGYRDQLPVGGCMPGNEIDVARCSTLHDTWVRYDRQTNLMHGMFIGAGIAGAATVATYFLWPNQARERRERTANNADIRAWGSKNGVGLQFAGAF